MQNENPLQPNQFVPTPPAQNPTTPTPPPQATSPSVPPVFNVMPHESAVAPASVETGKNLWKVISLSLIGVLVLVGLAYGYFLYSERKESPEEILTKSLQAFSQVYSFDYRGIVSLPDSTGEVLSYLPTSSTQEASAPSNTLLSMDFSGRVDAKEGQSIRSQVLVGIEGFETELILIGGESYAKFDSNLPEFKTLFPTLFGQWVKFDFDTLSNIFGGLGQVPTSTSPQEIVARSSLAEIEEMRSRLTSYKVFRIEEVLPEAKLMDKELYHYRFVVDKIELEKVLREVSLTSGEMSEEENREMSDLFSRIGEVRGEIFIGQVDYLPYRIVLDMSLVKNSPNERVGLNVFLSNFNQVAPIVAPTSFRAFEEVLLEVLPSLFGESI